MDKTAEKKKIYSKKALIAEISRRTKIKLSWTSLWIYENKGYLKNSFVITNGKSLDPAYSESDIDRFIDRLGDLEIQKKVRLKRCLDAIKK